MRLSPHLADDVVFKRFQSGEELVHAHLSGDNQTQVIRSVELLVVGSHLPTQRHQKEDMVDRQGSGGERERKGNALFVNKH